MHLFIQATLIHQNMDITIVRSRINQNINNLITNLSFHLDNECLMASLPVIHCYIKPRNNLPNISNYLCLLNCKSEVFHPSVMGNLLCDALHHKSKTTKASWHRPYSSPRVETHVLCQLHWTSYKVYILLITSIMIFSSLLNPLSFSFIITFPTPLRLKLALKLLTTILQLPDDFLQWPRLIILNLILEF